MKDDALQWIDTQHDRMVALVTRWAEINSGTRNLPGLAALSRELQSEFACLDGQMCEIQLAPETTIDNTGRAVSTPLGKAISIRKRPDAPTQVFLGIHMDTVFGVDHPFQHVRRMDDHTLNGPGVADAKGGLCVMLIALQAFERSESARRIGWEILINPDEEIGSPGSADLFTQSALRNQIGLIFEPGHGDGALVGDRKGAGNFTAVIRGKAAHAGRDFHLGRNAIHAAAQMVVALEQLNRSDAGVTLNVGRIDGGGPTNIVPDLAIVRWNVRVPDQPQRLQVENQIQQIVKTVSKRDGIRIELTGGFTSPPRPMDDRTTALYQQIAACGKDLGMSITWHASGGLSDANQLAAAGLPVVDSLGPCGGNLHSDQEFMLTKTLTQKAKLATLFLLNLAQTVDRKM